MYTLYLFTENAELKELYEKVAATHELTTRGDAGIDLYSPSSVDTNDLMAKKMKTLFLNHQIVCRMTKQINDKNDEVAVSYYLYPRSSISKTPFRLANSVGIIDSGYRGNIIAAIDYSREEEYVLEKFQRIVQICAPTLEPVRLVVCDSLDEMEMNTARSTGGFGSSGK